MTKEVSIERAIEAAKPLYADLPYHGWSHAIDVMNDADSMVTRLEKRGFKVARNLVRVAAIFHDAGYAEDHIALGYATKEQYSAALARDYLLSESVDDESIEIVNDGIIGTTHGAKRETIEARVIHRADVKNIGDLYSAFYIKNSKLRQEQQLIEGTLPSWESWQKGTVAFVDFCINESREELPRLGFTMGGPMSFDTLAIRNRDRFNTELDPERKQAA